MFIYINLHIYTPSGSTSILTVKSCLANVKYVTIIITNSVKLYYEMIMHIELNTVFDKYY